MKKQVGILIGLAFSICIMACGNNSSDETGTTDTSSTNVQMMDSGANAAPAQGMGDTTLVKDSNMAGSTPGSANDSVKRIGGSSTSDGDSIRRGQGN